DLSQRCVQAIWETDSPLKQIPHFNTDVINCCQDAGMELVCNIMEVEDDKRDWLLQ
ncbi:hypothetical protein BS47DRAFT_1285102, partial [Hydnum rufescens UP504]